MQLVVTSRPAFVPSRNILVGTFWLPSQSFLLTTLPLWCTPPYRVWDTDAARVDAPKLARELLGAPAARALVATMSVGYDHLDLGALKERNIKVKPSYFTWTCLIMIYVFLSHTILLFCHIINHVTLPGWLHSWRPDGCRCRHDCHFTFVHSKEAS